VTETDKDMGEMGSYTEERCPEIVLWVVKDPQFVS
jgi:hypothetical protein